jgi:stage II sporulation protein D
VIGRRRFVALGTGAVLGALGSSRAARATGGLDPELGTPPPLIGSAIGSTNPIVRILLARDIDPRRVSSGSDGATFSFGGKMYRGSSSIAAGALIATLPIDAYLYGVVPLEIGRGWPEAALQAQAIVARTFALAHRVRGKAFDLIAGEGDQVWGGMASESPQTNAAVDATEGGVVSYFGGLASVFYSACCGGHTADASRLWGGAALPYLRGVADSYCMSASPYAHWSATITVGDLVAALGPKIRPAGDLTSIALADVAADQRPGLRLAGKNGVVQLSSAEVRSALGARILKSGVFRSVTVDGDPSQAATLLKIEGSGLGHGVGLCQWGARVMAQQGRSARDIVGFYFPGTIVTNV